tara:strand:- start:3454 stop:4251 length:798 start_codon:yes stop_codon:yes gene_type:complete
MSNSKGSALITGASSGIGEALAWIFAEHGYDLILVARSADKLDALADELVAAHAVSVSVRPADLAVAGSAQSLARTLQREGLTVDVLVNNAGVLQHGRFTDMDAEEHQRMIALNVAGLTELLSSFVPQLVEQGAGRVLNVASIAAFQPIPSIATYAATKAYVLSLSEALGEELRGTGVTVTTLCPGVTETNMVAQAKQSSAGVNKLPAMLIGDVETVAREAFRGCMKGTPIIVPGTLNLAGTLLARTTPKWLVRRLTGAMGRSTL